MKINLLISSNPIQDLAMTNYKDIKVNGLPPRPQAPKPDECCGRNCENCVYVYYEKALKRWESKIRQLKNLSS